MGSFPMSARYASYLFLAAAALSLWSLPFAASAEVTCKTGKSRAATSADLPTMTAAGIPNPVVGMDWCPDDTNAGQAAGETKQFLKSILCSPDRDNYGGMGADDTIERLDSKFARCAAKFLKDAKNNGVSVCIREGARSVAKQNEYVQRGVIACKKGAMCEHPRGIAIDVNVLNGQGVSNCASYTRLHQSAPSYGLTFYLGCKDAYHFVPAKGSGDCSGGGILQQDDYDYPQYYSTGPNQTTPSSSLSNAFRQAIGLPATTQAAQPTATQTTASSDTTTTSQVCAPAFSCTNGTMYYKSSSCVQQVYQVCPYGCSGDACAAASSTVGTISSAFKTSTTSATSSKTKTSDEEDTSQGTTDGTTAADSISSYLEAFTGTSVDVGTATPISLAMNTIKDIAWGVKDDESGVPTNGTTSGVVYSTQSINSQQTFVSSDLSGTVGSSYTPAQQTGLASVLAKMRSALEWALSYLKPFRGQSAMQIAD